MTAGQIPDHTTLWRFSDAHRAGMRVLRERTMTVAVEAELIDLALQAVDGSKVLVNAAKERTLNAPGTEAIAAAYRPGHSSPMNVPLISRSQPTEMAHYWDKLESTRHRLAGR